MTGLGATAIGFVDQWQLFSQHVPNLLKTRLHISVPGCSLGFYFFFPFFFSFSFWNLYAFFSGMSRRRWEGGDTIKSICLRCIYPEIIRKPCWESALEAIVISPSLAFLPSLPMLPLTRLWEDQVHMGTLLSYPLLRPSFLGSCLLLYISSTWGEE